MKLSNKNLEKKAFEYAKSIVKIVGKRPNRQGNDAILSVASDYSSGYIQAIKDISAIELPSKLTQNNQHANP